MAKTKFKVTADRVSVGGKTYKKGDIFEAETKSAHVATALHFKQLQEVTAPTGEVVPSFDRGKPDDPVSTGTADISKEPESNVGPKAEPETTKKAETAPKSGK